MLRGLRACRCHLRSRTAGQKRMAAREQETLRGVRATQNASAACQGRVQRAAGADRAWSVHVLSADSSSQHMIAQAGLVRVCCAQRALGLCTRSQEACVRMHDTVKASAFEQEGGFHRQRAAACACCPAQSRKVPGRAVHAVPKPFRAAHRAWAFFSQYALKSRGGHPCSPTRTLHLTPELRKAQGTQAPGSPRHAGPRHQAAPLPPHTHTPCLSCRTRPSPPWRATPSARPRRCPCPSR